MTRPTRDDEPISFERFVSIVDAYGAAPEAWPDQERAGAIALLETSDEAVRLCDEAADLDRMLDEAPSVEPSAELRQRVLEGVPQPAVPWTRRLADVVDALWPFGPVWQPATALAVAAILGVSVGLVAPGSGSETEATVVAEVALETGEYWSEEP